MKKTFGRWVIAGALALGACGGSSASTETAHVEEDHHEHASGGEATSLVPPGQATIGDRSTCTVSGEEITITETTLHAEYEGRTYYFCCPHCVERFQANPSEFVPATTETEAAPSAS